MPRSKLARRFEPRGGVSQSTLDIESKYVGRELDDYLLYSLTNLREKLKEIQRKIATAEENLQTKLSCLPNRERLALRCMLARDMYHIAMLYSTFIDSSTVGDATGTSDPLSEEINGSTDEPIASLPFSDWLFES
jgi:tetrahydromethanopterin S-methyltransferase subunit B